MSLFNLIEIGDVVTHKGADQVSPTSGPSSSSTVMYFLCLSLSFDKRFQSESGSGGDSGKKHFASQSWLRRHSAALV